jgi:hypothetical protein
MGLMRDNGCGKGAPKQEESMKTVAIAAAASLLAASLAHAAESPSSGPSPAAPAGNVCLWTYQIDHTSVPDENTIVFHMIGGKTWVNKLAGPCPGLKFHGFTYVVRGSGEICGNQQSIRVLQTGAVCLLGPFTPGGEPPASGKTP